MKNSTLIKRVHMNCPVCDKLHDVEERKRTTTLWIKDDEVEYEEIYYVCINSREDENEFETGKMSNINLLNARNEYRRKHRLLTADEIVGIRAGYGLSQVEFARLMGWGEATISRYESKAIQDEAYDNMLKIAKDNPSIVMELFNKNAQKFSLQRQKQIYEKIAEKLEVYGKEYLSRKQLESEYVLYSEPSERNGFSELNIDKIESMVSYFAEKVSNLYKVKLMKMLWYSDALMYKTTGKAMTGLVYRHDKMGALPIGHNRLINLENINMQEEEGYDTTSYHFYPNKYIGLQCLNRDEIEVLEKVVKKFKDYTSQEIVKYMHEEKAYTETMKGEIISFELAKEIRIF